jgi:hypothetical protein
VLLAGVAKALGEVHVVFGDRQEITYQRAGEFISAFLRRWVPCFRGSLAVQGYPATTPRKHG